MSLSDKGIELLKKHVDDSEITFKIVVLGDSFVGKSCLALKAVHNTFNNNYSSTVGFEFLNYSTKLENYNIKLQVWDTCGQETYRSLISSFYHSSSLAILVYAIDNISSFYNIEVWLEEIKTKGNSDILLMLIGNKADIENKREVTKEMANEFCERNNIKIFMEASAKTGYNVDNIFKEATKILLEQHQRQKIYIYRPESMRHIEYHEEELDKTRTKEIVLSESDSFFTQKKKRRCCF